MVELPGQVPIFIIVDALDGCSNSTGTPSAREEVLDFVEDVVGSNHSNLFICVTSRSEQDIQTILGPLASTSCCVSLHEEGGSKEGHRQLYPRVCSEGPSNTEMERTRNYDAVPTG